MLYSCTHMATMGVKGLTFFDGFVRRSFGSHRIGTRTGILFNDEMNDFHSPMTTSANRVAPGKRPQSSMCPAIILGPHRDVVMAIGASGAARITSATACVCVDCIA